MKTPRILLAFLLTVAGLYAAAQGVGINTNGNPPDPSAGLDVDYSDKGFLTPRMTDSQRDAIQNPADGLMIFNTTSGCFNYRSSGTWLEMCGLCTPQPTAANAGPDQNGLSGTSATLAANTPSSGTGSWSIISGSGGNVTSPSSPGSTFTGLAGTSYTLLWTITTSCTTSQDEVIIDFVPDYTNYPNGNEAYWTERNLGYGPVTIGGGSVIYTYNSGTKQYTNGNLILLPNLVSSADGQTVSATSFYGLSGGSASDLNYQWDTQTLAENNQGSGYTTTFDVGNMFVSPMSASGLPNYCKIMQNNYAGSTCLGSDAITIDGPNSTLAYPSYSPGSGSYITYNGQEYVNAGAIKGSSWNEFVSQQQLDATTNKTYCVATYGKGWRLPTSMEAGHYADAYNSAALGVDDAYRGNSGNWIWTSTRFDIYNFHRMVLRSNDGYWYISWQNQDLVGDDGVLGRVRCVYPGY